MTHAETREQRERRLARARKDRMKARRDRGVVLVEVEVGENVIDSLTVLGWLDVCDSYRREPVQKAVARFLDAVPAIAGTHSGSE